MHQDYEGIEKSPSSRITRAKESLARGREYRDEGKLDEALREAETAIETDPDCAEAWNERGLILQGKGDLVGAVESFKCAVGKDCGLVQARDNLSRAEMRLNRPWRVTDEEWKRPGSALVTVATFTYPGEAHLASARLESEGVPAFVADEYVITMNWLYSTALGGVKVQVRDCDVELAAAILGISDRFARTPESGLGDPSLVKWSPDGCPRCGSSLVRYEAFRNRLVFLFWLVTALLPVPGQYGLPFPFLKRRWRCGNCGNEWKG